ncbi:hypothetical protein K439DRAFT_1665768 [Ramaria rubella]|nr:hypothetical protein K439DRAFT_1665768 [Ramaria rubella]
MLGILGIIYAVICVSEGAAVLVGPPSNCSAIKVAAKQALDNCTVVHCTCTTQFLHLSGYVFCLKESGLDYWDSVSELVYFWNENAKLCRAEGCNVEDVKFLITPDETMTLEYFHHEDNILKQQQMTFLALQIIGGQLGLVILFLIPIFSRKVHRNAAFFNFCSSWILSSVVFSLALYRGISNPTVAFPFSASWYPDTLGCSVQVALSSGVQPMTAVSTFALICQLWIDLRQSIYPPGLNPNQLWHLKIILLTTPYMVLVLFAVPTGFLSSYNDFFYCSTKSSSWQSAIILTVALVLGVAFLFDVLLLKMVYTHWSTFRKTPTSSAIRMSLIFRLVGFSIYRLIVAVAYILQIFPSSPRDLEDHVLLDMAQAATPLVVFLALGTTRENLSAFAFWNTKPWKQHDIPSTSLKISRSTLCLR